MNELKHRVLLHIADHAEVMHLALEGKDLNFDDRVRYLGHLAMCARFFKAVLLDDPLEFMEDCVAIESNSFKYTPRNERGNIARESWDHLSAALEQYIVMRGGA